MEQLLGALQALNLSALWWALLIGAAYLVLRRGKRKDDSRSILIGGERDKLVPSSFKANAVIAAVIDRFFRKSTSAEHGTIAGEDLPPAAGPTAGGEDGGPSFHLRFDMGLPGANALIRGRDVRLVFGAGKTLSRMSSLFPAASLQLPTKGRIQLTLALSTDEGLDVVGPQVEVATFQSGRLEREVSFDLHVRDDCPETVTVLVEFFLRGLRVYGHTLTANVAAAPSHTNELPAFIPRPIPLDIGRIAKQAERLPVATGLLELRVRCGSSGLQLSLSHRRPGPMDVIAQSLDASVPSLNLAGLAAIVSLIRDELGESFFASDLWETQVVKPSTQRHAQDLAECFERTASAGWSMRTELVRNSAEALALFDYIDAQPVGTRLVVNTSGPLLPFELLYGQPFGADWLEEHKSRHPVDPDRFWGLRFAIEVIRPRQGDGLDLLNAHLASKPSVSLNLHPSLKGAQSPDPSKIHRDLEAALALKEVSCHSNAECTPIRQILQGGAPDIRLIYVYCHGQPADAGRFEELELAPSCRLKPSALSPEARLPSAPIVFLNACSSGASSPLLFTGFLEAFQRQGALGLVATNFSVPIAFGATFGAEVVQACLFPEVSLAEEVRQLRCSHAEHRNPVPLFYSVQCQLMREAR